MGSYWWIEASNLPGYSTLLQRGPFDIFPLFFIFTALASLFLDAGCYHTAVVVEFPDSIAHFENKQGKITIQHNYSANNESVAQYLLRLLKNICIQILGYQFIFAVVFLSNYSRPLHLSKYFSSIVHTWQFTCMHRASEALELSEGQLLFHRAMLYRAVPTLLMPNYSLNSRRVLLLIGLFSFEKYFKEESIY